MELHHLPAATTTYTAMTLSRMPSCDGHQFDPWIAQECQSFLRQSTGFRQDGDERERRLPIGNSTPAAAKRGVFRSVADLQAAINRFLDDHNAQSKPFQWVADPDEIIAAVRRGHQALDLDPLAACRT